MIRSLLARWLVGFVRRDAPPGERPQRVSMPSSYVAGGQSGAARALADLDRRIQQDGGE